MNGNTLIYILIVIAVTNLIRVIPMLLIKGQIHNRFVRSFLYYVPYVTLAVMTFPAIIEATQTPWSGAIAFAVGIIAALMGQGLPVVAALCCITVFVIEMLII